MLATAASRRGPTSRHPPGAWAPGRVAQPTTLPLRHFCLWSSPAVSRAGRSGCAPVCGLAGGCQPPRAPLTLRRAW